MNQRIHEWLDAHELLKFLLVMFLAAGLSLFTSSWMLHHALIVTVAFVIVAAWFMISRIIYLCKGGAL